MFKKVGINYFILVIFFLCFSFQEISFAQNVNPGYSGETALESLKILDLKTAQKIAIKDNPSLAAAEERVRQARQQVIQAYSSYWPRIDATGGGRRTIMSENDYLLLGVADDRSDTYTAGISASWVLFNGFEREYSSLRARYGEDGSKQAHLNVLRLLLLQVASSYFNAQLARENIIISQANEEFNQRQLVEAEARNRVGTGSLSDVLNFRVRINSAKSQLIASRRAYQVALYGLAALMGIPDSKMPPHLELAELKNETTNELLIPEPEAAVRYALENRPDLKQREYLLKQADAGVGSAWAGFYPTISITGSIDGDRLNSRELEREDFGKSIMLNISYNIFSGGQTTARLKEAKSRKREAVKNLDDATISVKTEVESAITQLKAAQEQLSLQRTNTKLVQETRDLVEKEYAAGQGSLVRLNEAQLDLVTAQSTLALSLVSMRQAWESLRASTGKILQTYLE